MEQPTDQDILALDRRHTDTHQGMLALAVPPPAEPIAPEDRRLLDEQVTRALTMVIGENPPQANPDAALVALKTAIDQCGGELCRRYAFDLESMRTGEGVKTLAMQVAGLASDGPAIEELRAGPQAGLPGAPAY